MSQQERCTECGKPFAKGGGYDWDYSARDSTGWGYKRTPRGRQARAITCSAKCARERKTRFQKRRRDAAKKKSAKKARRA